MIPTEVAAIATLIWPVWRDSDDEEAVGEVIASAWRIHNAGYVLKTAQGK
jgi:hypothetical protein